ncbi:hypothetical protein PLESTB_000404100 [Pleodorina starrii]|uniref:Cytosol aminopeptidase domain-containing protein n=1 Tax=Pleodorina starrii TaxID=330485 RepID=A0A9W6EZI9_9CHLO|nr:hypothetical protein PLESTB_000404100 [Pleodorina starrii]
MRLPSFSSFRIPYSQANRQLYPAQTGALRFCAQHLLLNNISKSCTQQIASRKLAASASSAEMASTSMPAELASLEYWFSRSGRYEEFLVDASEQELQAAIPVQAVAQADLTPLLSSLEPLHRSWAATSRFKAKAGEVCLLPDAQGTLSRVLLGLGPPSTAPWAYAALAKLPGGTYRLTKPYGGAGATAAATAAAADAAAGAASSSSPSSSSSCCPSDGSIADRAALGFLLGHYSFERYKAAQGDKGAAEGGQGGQGGEGGEGGAEEAKARLVWPEGCDRTQVLSLARSFVWCRDLITTPAEDLGPQHLAAEAGALAAALSVTHGSVSCSVLQGEQLLEANYPAIHTVGRASCRPPLLATLRWSPPDLADPSSLPLLALVGKGVCFDTGGLNLKPGASMKNMKKDMGGAALVLSLAQLLIRCRLRARLLVLVPAVENSVAGNAYRPLDVLRTRAGISVENGNCDAEGRLILADALTEATAAGPDLIIDAATLTGAARTALGAELPAVFTNDDVIWRQLEEAAAAESDPVWRLPLHAPYRKQLDSRVADLSSTGTGDGLAGAIMAALFLQEFVKGAPRWVHIDTSAFTSGGAGGPTEWSRI